MKSLRLFFSNTSVAYGVALIALVGGLATGRALSSAGADDQSVVRQGGYEFINPLLLCDAGETSPEPTFAPLQSQLQQQIDTLIRSGSATRISVYFRSMDYGTWTGVHQGDLFIPASMMKVPILIAYFADSGADPSLLQRMYTLHGADQNAGESIQPTHPLLLGGSYTVQELLDAMVKQSDNNAAAALVAHISTTTIDNVYNTADLPNSDENTDSISPENYMRTFRILYNGSYIGKRRSQTALQMLSQSTFSEGIVAGVPKGMPVAHKFGEREVRVQNAQTGAITTSKVELSDCGIVYYPDSPYGLCVMTEGASIPRLEFVIAQLSRTAYQQVASGIFKR